jgi:beta-lactamase class A
MLVIQDLCLTCLPALARDNNQFISLEKQIGGRIGVFALDTGTGRRTIYRSGERFAMGSTFKLLLVAHVLHRVDEGNERLERIIPYSREDLLSYAPITSKHLDERGMTVGELCAAALQYSDNTAANLLLRIQGGPQGFTRYARYLGDRMTHLDRVEPLLNTPVLGKELDTTTPEAMAKNLRKLLVGTTLSAPSRERMKNWLLGNTTGSTRLKAGLPKSWHIADKTGTGDNGATNDIGILYPPDGAPIVIAAYVSDSKGPRADSEAALADIARIITKMLAQPVSF